MFARLIASACVMSALAVPALAQTIKAERFRAFLIWEESGELSKNVIADTPRIEANTQKGMSSQIMVDIVVSGPKNTQTKGQYILYTWANVLGEPAGTPSILDKGFPVTYIGAKGETTRTVIIEHDCRPFVLSARVDRGNTTGRVLEKRFQIFCGD